MNFLMRLNFDVISVSSACDSLRKELSAIYNARLISSMPSGILSRNWVILFCLFFNSVKIFSILLINFSLTKEIGY